MLVVGSDKGSVTVKIVETLILGEETGIVDFVMLKMEARWDRPG